MSDGVLLFKLDLDKINDLQLESMRKCIRKAKHAHYTNVDLRINGQNVIFEADWLKHFEECVPVLAKGQK